jgi:hypothetical protein
MGKAALGAAAVIIALALIIVLYRPAKQNPDSAFNRFAQGLPGSAPQELSAQRPPTQFEQVPVAVIPHTTAPDPRVLASDPAKQATYDTAARPGEFVTPPIVSVEH